MAKVVPLSIGIKAIEAATGLKFSPEQLQILRYNYRTPVLVNSCAGSGKTTLGTDSIVLQVITGRQYPQHIIGITFSRKARLNMQMKYNQILDHLSELGLDFRDAPKPYFTTFHALFYHLLERVQTIHVLPSYSYITMDLMHAMKVHSKFSSALDVLSSIFQLRSQLIDHQYSWTGVDLRHQNPTMTNLKNDAEKMGDSHSKSFYKNYLPVVRTYIHYKHQHHLIDFNDMKVNLYRALGHDDKRAVILRAMKPYQMCFIDEFQDIDPIQWQLIKKLMPTQVLERLAVIGDDDQSIYAFRGSDPDIILNIQHNYPHIKVFNLTTNYRTAGNVLNCAIPLITNNKYRLGKPLRAFHKHTGRLICFKGNNYKSGSAMLLHHLSKQIHSPKIDNDKIAVLCRYNLDKTLAVDWLANQHQYIHTSRSDILQNNYMYRIFYDLMKALFTDNFSLFRRHAKRIGFYAYSKHIYTVLKYNGLVTVRHLSKYLALAKVFDHKFKKQMEHIKHGTYALRNDRNLLEAFVDINKRQKKHMHVSGTLILGDIDDLTSYYFQFMCRHNYINEDLYNAILQYLIGRMTTIKDVAKFFGQEENKRDLLEHPNMNQLTKVHVITIHQSKGLQFDYVYLYNLRDLDVNENMINVNHIFAPNVTRKQFFTMLLSLSKQKIKSINYLPILVKKFRGAVRVNRNLILREPVKKQHGNAAEMAINQALKHSLQDMHLQKDLDSAYNSVVMESHVVEEERRLIYVALTRTIKGAYYNDDVHMSPLLKEIAVPKKNVIEMGKDKKIYNLSQKLHKSGLTGHQMNALADVLKHLNN